MPLKVYNTLSRKKEEFKPLKDGKVNVFVCGPTVYDNSHIGHGKTYTQFDIIIRYLRKKGFEVFYLMNFTDIDDKIINRAKEKGIDWKDLKDEYEKKFLEDMKKLKNDSVTEYARATDHIPQIIDQVKRLIDRGFAYETSDGIYFHIPEFKDYGKLSNQDMEQIRSGARVDVNKEKKHPADFVLWKKHKPGEPYWDSPWGKGRPGWHIEDTAITEHYFGPQYDLHGGAEDLIFPHHESEIAQQEAASGKEPLVKYWLHTAFLNMNEEKMSKSLGNIIPIKDAVDEWGADTLRYYYVINHYRTPLEYADENLEHARNALKKLNNFVQEVSSAVGVGDEKAVEEACGELLRKFEERMDDDFDTPGATAALFDFIHVINKLDISSEDAEKILETLKYFDEVFQILSFEQEEAPQEVKELADKREEARQSKNWDESDKLRNKIKEKGWSVEDTPKGYRLKKV